VQTSTAHFGSYEFYKERADEFEEVIDWLGAGEALSKLPKSYLLIQFAAMDLKVDVSDVLGTSYLTIDDGGLKAEYDSKQVQQVIEVTCETMGITDINFRIIFEDFLTNSLGDCRAEQQRQLRSYDHGLLLASVPDDANFARMVRYDALLFNQYRKLFHEFQRIQAVRLGANLSLPVALDVNVGV